MSFADALTTIEIHFFLFRILKGRNQVASQFFENQITCPSKSCFLYFAIFPEDYSINCGRFIRLWIAEGFVKGKKGITLEQVAKEYLTELIHRSLVQLSYVDYLGKIRSCRVHDLMREIILRKAEELSFCRALGEEDSSFDGKFRLISIQKSKDNVVETTNRNSQIHLGNLFHLRYLSLRRTKVKMLPKSIGKLQNLQTLDLKHSLVDALPVEIEKLQKLHHILSYSYNYHSVGQLPSVRVLVGEKLKRLQLTDMKGLKTLKIHDGASPLLEHLEIGPSPQLEEVPSGIRFLETLRRIDFWDMSTEFTNSMLLGTKMTTKNVIPNPGLCLVITVGHRSSLKFLLLKIKLCKDTSLSIPYKIDVMFFSFSMYYYYFPFRDRGNPSF
ncbi:unnamed protein product, partial [Vitis vinifera]